MNKTVGTLGSRMLMAAAGDLPGPSGSSGKPGQPVRNVVLVHGGFVDGSGCAALGAHRAAGPGVQVQSHDVGIVPGHRPHNDQILVMGHDLGHLQARAAQAPQRGLRTTLVTKGTRQRIVGVDFWSFSSTH